MPFINLTDVLIPDQLATSDEMDTVCAADSRLINMSNFHSDWYQQRYGSAQVSKRQQQLYAARSAHYEELKEHRQEKRQTYQDNAVSVFAEHGISYESRGHSWLCTVGDEQLYYWPKSGRWRVKGKRKVWGSRGAQDFLDKVQCYQDGIPQNAIFEKAAYHP